MFGIDWTTWLLLVGILFLMTVFVLMFLLPFSVFKIRNILIDMSEDLNEIARNVYFIAKEIESKKKEPHEPPSSDNP
jgi:hypothetical protein